MCELLRAISRISLQKERERRRRKGEGEGGRRERGREGGRKKRTETKCQGAVLNADSSLSKTKNSQLFGIKLYPLRAKKLSLE